MKKTNNFLNSFMRYMRLWTFGICFILIIFGIMILGNFLHSFLSEIINTTSQIKNIYSKIFIIIIFAFFIISVPYLIGASFERIVFAETKQNNMLMYYKKLEADKVININVSQIHGKNLYTLHYLRTQIDFNNPFIRLARGTTINEKGEIVLRAPSKYFAHNELKDNILYSDDFKREFAMIENPNKVLPYMRRIPSKLIMAGVYDDQLIISSRYSLDDITVHEARNYIRKNNLAPNIIEVCKKYNITLILDYCSVNLSADSLLPCKEDGMYLSGITSNDYNTDTMASEGYYDTLVNISHYINIPTPELYYGTLSEIIDMAKHDTESKGYTMINEHRHNIKFNTDWWIRKITDLSGFRECEKEEDIAVIVLKIWQTSVKTDILGNIQFDKELTDEKKKVINRIATNIRIVMDDVRETYSKVYFRTGDIKDIIKNIEIPAIIRELTLNLHRYGAKFPEGIDRRRVAQDILVYMNNRDEYINNIDDIIEFGINKK